MNITKGAEIARLNDISRKLGLGVTMTDGAVMLPDVCGLLQSIRAYNQFDEGNDPYGEHDFGKLNWHGHSVFWKIDYYNETLSYWEDPMSPKCKRVLTVMRADEY